MTETAFSEIRRTLPPRFRNLAYDGPDSREGAWLNEHILTLAKMMGNRACAWSAEAHLQQLYGLAPPQRLEFASAQLNDSASAHAAPRFLESCHTVSQLLAAAQAAAVALPAGEVKDALLQRLKPFERGVAVAFYNREELREQAPAHLRGELSNDLIDVALESLVRNFEHPWDSMAGYVLAASASTKSPGAGRRPRP